MIAATRDAGLIVLGIILVLLALAAGHAIDTAHEQPSPALLDAQQQAQREAQHLRTAQAECRAVLGANATMFETPEGHLVCRRAAAPATRIAGGML